jgi:hypothetical protein
MANAITNTLAKKKFVLRHCTHVLIYTTNLDYVTTVVR